MAVSPSQRGFALAPASATRTRGWRRKEVGAATRLEAHIRTEVAHVGVQVRKVARNVPRAVLVLGRHGDVVASLASRARRQACCRPRLPTIVLCGAGRAVRHTHGQHAAGVEIAAGLGRGLSAIANSRVCQPGRRAERAVV